MNHMRMTPLLLLLAALLACKQRDHAQPAPTTAPRVIPGESPAVVLKRWSARPVMPTGIAVRVTGTVIESSGGTAIQCCQLDAGGGKHLHACMQIRQCFRGACAEDAPQVGSVATLQCVGGYMGETPLLTQCVRSGT